mmetsp:Transcript_26847/g.86907  ORF Transcript_26847/g.86907 Transcript_26847/m.86907 type:complete len:172 (+) Transcript_26847:55-570(+)
MDELGKQLQGVLDAAKERVDTFTSGKALLDEGGGPMRQKVSAKANAAAACVACAIALDQLKDAKEQLLAVSDAMRRAADDGAVRKCMLSDEIIEFGLLADKYEAYAKTVDDAVDSLQDDVPRPPMTTPAENDATLIISYSGQVPITDPVKRANDVATNAEPPASPAGPRPP